MQQSNQEGDGCVQKQDWWQWNRVKLVMVVILARDTNVTSDGGTEQARW